VDVDGKKVTVVGLGRTAVATVRLLLREGAQPFVTDSADGAKQQRWRTELDTLGVPYELGGHTDAAFDGADLVIPSPGVPPTLPCIEAAIERGVDMIGEMAFAFPYCRSRVLAVTGTNGKTTTTELLRFLLESCGHSVILAGNNDSPFSEAVLVDPAPEFIVLEVSSYQLETSRGFRPWMAAVLNITPDHLERHGDLNGYTAVKSRIFANQGPDDVAVINVDDPRVAAMAQECRAAVWPFSLESRPEAGLWLNGHAISHGGQPVADVSDTPLQGRHNLQNVLCALTMMRAGGFDWAKTLSGLREFRGVEHRIEYVATVDGIAFYNDSKSTNVDSLKVAIESFTVPVVLIAGGRGKGSDYGVLRDDVHRHVRRLVTLGEDAPAIEAAFGEVVAFERAGDMADAVTRAAAGAEAGDAVLLSPGCASFDMYENFEERGRDFKRLVSEYAAGRPGVKKEAPQ
jgi:UDP-N-acetylmuramoylalanine--D-glutamate ligase